MKPIFYFCCQSEECIEHHEGPFGMYWSTVAPQLGTLISIGSEERWCIVKITTYRSETAQDVDTVYVAYVHPLGLPIPPESEWDCDLVPDPPQSISAEIVLIGQMELGMCVGEGIDTPEIGEQIESILEPTEEGPVPLEVPKLWAINRVVSYSPTEEIRIQTLQETTFVKVFLCWCEPTDADPTT